MSQILTSRQAEELHKSIIAYLSRINASQSSAALREELQIGDSFDEATSKKYEGLLERKWTGVARLQRKILDLESKIASLQTELESAPTARSKRQDPTNWLPGTSPTHVFESHRDAVTCVAFHPVFTSLASGSEDCTIKIWDWELGELERTLKGHIRAISGLDFGGQKGHTLLASCSSDLTIKLWDPSKDYANIRTLSGHDHSVSAVRFLTPTGNLLVSASRDASIRIWDVGTGYCVKAINSQGSWIRDVSPSFDGKWLVSGGRDQAATIWEVSSADSKAVLLGHENFIECCVFAPPASYEHLATLAGLKKPPTSSSFEYIATGARDKTIKLWDSRGMLIKTLVGHDNWVRGLVFHPSGKYLFSVADDKTIRCWDLSQEGRLVKTIDNAHGHFVSCIRWAPSNTSDAETSETTNGMPKKDGAKPGYRCVIATGSADCCVRVFT
ncbi:Positively regulates the activity of the minus-end directed microtubule motor protein dynein [Aspergillus alliaceus]|uniref:Nuclear distribution protein nudF n=1 Tax=Petromyces alliaceus TaxID=209559 RepID=A0A5N6FP79_PETAA|nr:nuclear migration protein NudF [Aspergillus alliaceus]KAB8231437.1 nuclear migration protein NudF [Aspergillus alliaceus]KAE8391848.1 nuclear migration protein NudF [Aspergillus alliaceus]KAF5855980.1 Positively regulates the activity of the minus-end directed microtubule motor protein dynein [Aspergillus burnettii]